MIMHLQRYIAFFFYSGGPSPLKGRSQAPLGIDLDSAFFLASGERLIRRTPLNVEVSGLNEPGLEPLNSRLRD